MANFTMAELQALVHQEHGHETSRDHVRVQKRILAVVDKQGRSSRSQIAKALKLKKTPWLHANIEQLVEDGRLERSHTVRPNGVVMFWYEVGKPRRSELPDWLIEQSKKQNAL